MTGIHGRRLLCRDRSFLRQATNKQFPTVLAPLEYHAVPVSVLSYQPSVRQSGGQIARDPTPPYQHWTGLLLVRPPEWGSFVIVPAVPPGSCTSATRPIRAACPKHHVFVLFSHPSFSQIALVIYPFARYNCANMRLTWTLAAALAARFTSAASYDDMSVSLPSRAFLLGLSSTSSNKSQR